MTPSSGPDPRYPIGKYSEFSAQSPRPTRDWCVEELRSAAGRYRDAVAGLDDSQLDTPYRDGGWTVRQVVHHVADSHMNSYIRCKLALTEDEPTIKPYDEAAWAECADSRGSVQPSLNLIEALHLRWVDLLQSLNEEQWLRNYKHPERGTTNLEQTALLYGWHTSHHLAHITGVRQRYGW